MKTRVSLRYSASYCRYKKRVLIFLGKMEKTVCLEFFNFMEEGNWIWPKEGPVQFYSKALTLIWVGSLGIHFDVGKIGGEGVNYTPV